MKIVLFEQLKEQQERSKLFVKAVKVAYIFISDSLLKLDRICEMEEYIYQYLFLASVELWI